MAPSISMSSNKRMFSVRFILALLVASVACVPISQGVQQRIEAGAWLMTALRFIDSTDASNATRLIVCFPKDQAVAALVQNQSVRNLTLIAMPLSSPQESGPCNVFVTLSTAALNRANWLATLAGRPVLTIGLDAEFCVTGGVVCLASGNHTSQIFGVNRTALSRAGLRVNSHLPFFEVSAPGGTAAR
jgi:YfiR/HmsC-like